MSWLFQRLFSAALVIFSVTLVVFFLIHLIPGDPVDVMLGETATVADRQAMRISLGLDQPLPVQLLDYLQGLFQLDFGQSLHSKEPISRILAQRLPATARLALSAMFIAMMLAIPLGIFSAVYKGSWIDRTAMLVSLAGLSIPNFLLGPLLVLVFSIALGLLPVSGNDSLLHLILPSITLGLSMAAVLARMVRSSLLETLGEDFIRTAHAKGMHPRDVIWKHAMRNAWLPVITVIGAQIGALLGGAVVTETVFDWPGLGSLMIESIQKRDYPIVQACVLIISVIYVVVNALTDLCYGLLD
ncbi:MAG: ABC transporter permease, partial [Gammaproteobacteria bacterium]|nr:ABC transporter permease [Gammaproteobacteria bacterium]